MVVNMNTVDRVVQPAGRPVAFFQNFKKALEKPVGRPSGRPAFFKILPIVPTLTVDDNDHGADDSCDVISDSDDGANDSVADLFLLREKLLGLMTGARVPAVVGGIFSSSRSASNFKTSPVVGVMFTYSPPSLPSVNGNKEDSLI
jgi:hypothetical protein